MAKEAKFVCVDIGEFGFVITDDNELRIIEVETETKITYSKELVNELIDFLSKYWVD